MNNDGPKLHKAGSVIRELREEAGLSLSDLAQKMGWDKGRLSKYENDGLGLSAQTIEKIATALNFNPEVLLLKCLQHKYPRLAEAKTGKLIEEAIRELSR
jgi:transcriptional regulator with XRE-family HTH domain